MIYDPSNAAGSKVYRGMWEGDQITHVSHVDTDRAEVVVYEHPLRIVGDDVATKTLRFDFISVEHEQGTVYGFRCYGER